MKLLFITILLMTIISFTCATFNLLAEWNEYKRKYEKTYNGIDNIYRKTVYLTNSNAIRRHNRRYQRGCETYELGVNQFTDMTFQEYSNIFLGSNSNIRPPAINGRPPIGKCNNENIVGSWMNSDWRTFGAVNEVQDQGTFCNAGWAFASLSAVESRTFITTVTLPPALSAQNLIDCVPPRTCDGKTPEEAYQYLIENQNVNPSNTYPYNGRASATCNYNSNNFGATCAAYRPFTGSDTELENLVRMQGPVVVAVDPLSFTFMHYKSGVYRDSYSNRNRNAAPNYVHYVSLIGAGSDGKSGNYWIAKNSFGATWGENGYMRIQSEGQSTFSKISYPLA